MPRELSLAVVGADHPNKKGPGRRFEIKICKPGERVDLIPEPRNPADPHAVAVYSCRGIQIGYVTAERAPMVGAAIRNGDVNAIFQQPDKWGATIRVALKGGVPTLPEAGESRGVVWPPPGSDDADWWPDEEWPEE